MKNLFLFVAAATLMVVALVYGPAPVIVVAGVTQTLFVVRFITRRWWETFLGRAVATKSLALWALIVAEVVSWFVSFPYWVERAIIVGVCVGIIWQTIAVYTADSPNQTSPSENQR